MFDNNKELSYNANDIRDLIDIAAATAAETTLRVLTPIISGSPGVTDLDNGIAQDENVSCSEGENNMARIKSRININGVDCWITADNVQALVDKALAAYQQSTQQAPQTHTEAPLFKDYAPRWYEVYESNKLKPTTAAGVQSYMTRHYIPFFGEYHMDQITVDLVQQFLNLRKNYAEKTLKDCRMWLSQILDAAVDDGYLDKNPARNKRIVIPSKKATEREALSESDFMDVYGQLGKLSESDRLLIALAMFTGMRRGEILGLQYADIDREGGWIHVRRNVTYPKINNYVIGTPKSKKGTRDIPIIPQLAAILPDRCDESFIFGGAQPLTHTQVVNTWNRIKKKINLHGATLHSLRHSFLTMASNSGIEPKTIQALAGHADVSITMNRYVHAQTEPIKRAGVTLGQRISHLGALQEYGNSPQALEA